MRCPAWLRGPGCGRGAARARQARTAGAGKHRAFPRGRRARPAQQAPAKRQPALPPPTAPRRSGEPGRPTHAVACAAILGAGAGPHAAAPRRRRAGRGGGGPSRAAAAASSSPPPSARACGRPLAPSLHQGRHACCGGVGARTHPLARSLARTDGRTDREIA
eukprot:scaffold3851_cov387-Prasinococcus_capsulatus_cf.AAC.12